MEEIIFPNQIRILRRVRGVTMKELAKALHVSLSAISKIEKGYRRLDEEQLTITAKLLDCPAQDLLVLEESSHPDIIASWEKEKERRSQVNEGSGLKTLGAGLRYIRARRNMTLLDVAKGAGMTLSVYHRIEMGQREVPEKEFERIARALGYEGQDLQIEIYNLDMAGALQELKEAPMGKKRALCCPRGGYNDLPMNHLIVRRADNSDTFVNVFGEKTDNNLISINKEQPVGKVVCPSDLAVSELVYAVPYLVPSLGDLLPERAILIVSPEQTLQENDWALFYPKENQACFVKIQGKMLEGQYACRYDTNEKVVLNTDDLSKVHKVVLVVFP